MQRILRDPGAEVIVGLLSFAVSFVGVGLAIAALSKPAWWFITSFVVAAVLFVSAIVAIFVLSIYRRTISRYQKRIAAYLRQAYSLRQEALTTWRPELAEATNQWIHQVQEWLDANLPEQAPDFGLDTIRSTVSTFFYDNIPKEASEVALLIEGRVVNLREILREIRT